MIQKQNEEINSLIEENIDMKNKMETHHQEFLSYKSWTINEIISLKEEINKIKETENSKINDEPEIEWENEYYKDEPDKVEDGSITENSENIFNEIDENRDGNFEIY